MNALEKWDGIFDVPVAPPVADPGRAARVFNGTYTVTFPDESHRTFRIHTKRQTAKFAPGQRLVSLLIGADNERDYKPFAFIDDAGIRVWRKYRGTQFDDYARILWALVAGMDGRPDISGHSLSVAGTCLVCNRLLTDPESIARGVGPHCWESRGKQE